MIELGTIRNTATYAVADVAANHVGTGPYSQVLVRSDRSVCLATGRDATTTDFLLKAGEPLKLALAKDETLSFILADGETSGSISLTECS